MIDPSEKIQMLNPAGRVVNVPMFQKKELLTKGFKIIVNAKEEWYPNYDTRNGEWNSERLNVVENIEPANFLEVKKI